MAPNKFRALLFAIPLIVVLLLVLGYRLIRTDEYAFSSGLLQRMPAFSVDAISGARVTSESLSEKVVLLQFIDGRNDGEVGFFQSVLKEWDKEALDLVLVMSHVGYFVGNRDIVVTPDVQIVDRDANKDIELAFGIGPKENKYYVFDSKGRLRDSGDTFRGYEDGPKIELKKLIYGEELRLSNLFPIGKNVSDVRWLNMLDGLAKSRKSDKYVIALFTSLCRGCYGGVLINLLDRAFLTSNERLFVAAILSQRFTAQDIKVLRSQLQVQLPLFIADDVLSEQWDSLIADFREDDLNNLILVLDSDGNISLVISQKCNCLGELQKILRNAEGH